MSKAVHRVYALLLEGLLIFCAVASAVLTQSNAAVAAGRHRVGSVAPAAVPTPDPFTKALIDKLEQGGFQVSQGYPVLYTPEDCLDHTFPVFKNCFMANPAGPYVVAVVKSWPHEYVDPATVNAFVET